MKEISITVNGEPHRLAINDGESLLETLRTRCGVYSPKDGCQPQGQCGCCVALVDGLPKTTCVVKAERVDGKSIQTLEGLPEEERGLIARSFVSVAGLQCGFCIPGIAMRAKALLDGNPDATREQIANGLAGHLCRCTGYVKILDAIEMMARARRGEEVPEPCQDGRVGASYAR